MERRSRRHQPGRTIHRRYDTVDETPGLLPKAHRTVVELAAPARCSRAVTRVMRCGVREVPHRSTTPNRQLPRTDTIIEPTSVTALDKQLPQHKFCPR